MLYSFLTDSALRIEDDTDFWFKEYGREFGDGIVSWVRLSFFGDFWRDIFFISDYLRT